MDHADKTLRAMAASPVTAGEVRALILCAQRAWRAQRALGLADEPFESWRRAALFDAVGQASFRALGQRDYGRALAHFVTLAGGEVRSAAGLAAAVARRETGPEGDRRRAAHKLRAACAEAADAFGGEDRAQAYASVLLRNIHRADLATATARQLVQVMFTLRARAAARRRAARKETP